MSSIRSWDVLDYYSPRPAYTQRGAADLFGRSCQRFYNNRVSPESVKWKQILYRRPANLDRVYNMNLSNKTFRRWLQLVGQKSCYRTAMLNYRDFYELSSIPNYMNVRRSSAGISGWTTAGPYT